LAIAKCLASAKPQAAIYGSKHKGNKTMIRASVLVCTGLLYAASTAFAQDYKVTAGDVAEQKGELTVKGRSAAVVLGGEKSPPMYTVSAELQLAPIAPKGGETFIALMPTDVRDLNKKGFMRLGIARDKDGLSLKLIPASFTGAAKKPWTPDGDVVSYVYWPNEKTKGVKAKNKSGGLEKAGVDRRTWRERWLPLRVEVTQKTITVWFDGEFALRTPRPEGMQGPVALYLTQGDQLRGVTTKELTESPRFMPIDLEGMANDHFAKPIGKRTIEVGGVPFELPQGGEDHLSLKQAEWTGWKQDFPWSHENALPAIRHDPRMPMLRVPVIDYVAAHVLAIADDDPETTAAFTLRAGHYGKSGNEQDVQYDFHASVPRRGQVKDGPGVVQTAAGPLVHVRVPFDLAIAQDIKKYIEIELTKEVRVARRSPDPNRFRYRPLGLPSGVRIAGLTFERSPLQMRVGSKEVGHSFVEPQQPVFQVTLSNITTLPQEYALNVEAIHLDGTSTKTQQKGQVAAGKTEEVTLTVPTKKRGYHELVVALEGTGKKLLLKRETSFALLPPDTRKHRDQSPFGTYSFGGTHYTGRPEETGPLYVKLGMRYGMFGNTSPEIRKKYGVLRGNEPNIAGKNSVAAWEKALEQDPLVPPAVLLFHETSISGKHITRTPDLFHDRPPYKMNEKEEAHFKSLWNTAVASTTAMREKYPKVHIRFGNNVHTFREEFYRHKFPAELFDSAGNEAGVFGSLPEAQPPDFLTNNASLWMDRQLLDAYGYKDKPVTMCHEVCYPSTNPGNLDLETQADYMVRHSMHALAWGIPEFRPGVLTDVGGNYRMSHWGSSGFCFCKPEFNVKPSFVAFATMTLMLDGARFVRVVPTSSASVFVLEFDRPDGGKVYSLWTVRGRRDVSFRADNGWKLVDSQANETDIKLPDSRKFVVTASSAPVYLVGKGALTFDSAATPEYDNRPAGKTSPLSSLASLNGWEMEKDRNAELEYYNFMLPRTKGDFAFEPVAEFEGRKQVMKITPLPIKHGKDTMPMYAVLTHKKGIAVPGTPTEVGVWVNGNSAWGRMMYEFEDASGQRWISLGAQAKNVNPWIDSIPKDLLDKFPNPGINEWSTDDSWGHSRINFDGWRYLAVPLPGQYPGEKYGWPAKSQWRWDKDGVVHYPLTFKKLIVELPQKTLHVKTFAPVARPEIYLKDLVVSQGDTALVKTTPAERPTMRSRQ
jgi:hypothetical protein